LTEHERREQRPSNSGNVCRDPDRGRRNFGRLLSASTVLVASLVAACGGATGPREQGITSGTNTTTKVEKSNDRRPRAVAWFEVAGKDGARMRAFYGDLFAWRTHDVAPGADYGVTDRVASGIGGGVGALPTGGPEHVTFFVEVDDIEATLREVERLGGKTVSGPRTFPDKRPSSRGRGTVTFAYFVDPEGHLVGLCTGILGP